MDAKRLLLVIADDFGIGPETTRGILDLAARGVVTGTVLLVNSPHAAAAIGAWRRAGSPCEVGWHPSLTLDEPCAPPGRVRSLVGPDGRLWPLGRFLLRLALGRIDPLEVEVELDAQLDRFVELVGSTPALVNAHQHVAVFPPITEVLLRVLRRCRSIPYLRRVREPWPLLATVSGARIKRAGLNLAGRRAARLQQRARFPGNEWLVGVTDPPCVTSPDYFRRWLTRVSGRVVELMCHPGHADSTLLGRDCVSGDGKLRRRVDEYKLLARPDFSGACREAGFVLASASEVLGNAAREVNRAG